MHRPNFFSRLQWLGYMVTSLQRSHVRFLAPSWGMFLYWIIILGYVRTEYRHQTEGKQENQSGNMCCYGGLKDLKSKLLTYTTKSKSYKTLFKPILLYGSETWVLTVTNILPSKERILGKIYGTVQDSVERQQRYNKALYQLYGAPNINTH